MATLRLCSIPDCSKPHYGRGVCNQHYQRWRSTGEFGAYIQPRKPKPATCAVDDCSNKTICRGFCEKHYSRLRRHGDPNKAGKTAHGQPLEYVETVVLNHEGDECLTWPFYRTSTFYGMVTVDGVREVATRYVCKRAHGPPPTPDHEAAHSCGNGHLGCISPQHLSWKTASRNQADKLIHGTDSFGEKSPNAKLSSEQVAEIRALVGTMRKTEIGRMFGVTASYVGVLARYGSRVLG